MRRVLGAALVLAAAGFARAEQVTVAFVVHGRIPSSPIAVSIEAKATRPGIPEVTLASNIPGSPAVDLVPGTTWLIDARATGYWTPRVAVFPAGQSPAVAKIDLWPVSTVSGRIACAAGDKGPTVLEMGFRPVPGVGEGALPQGEVECSVKAASGDFRCTLPSGTWDLRLHARGFVSHFFWGIAVPLEEGLAVGTRVLQRGASVVGWVETEDGQPPGPGVKVRMAPLMGGFPARPTHQERALQLGFETTCDKRGFFHFQQVPAGSFSITANLGRLVSAPHFPIPVVEGSETAVRDPIVLAPPLNLTVNVQPAIDPWARPWKICLLRQGIDGRSLDDVGCDEVEPQGQWRAKNLGAGDYVVSLSDRSGSKWVWQSFALRPGADTLDLDIPVVPVRGSVLLGDGPVAADLAFGGGRGSVKVLMHAGQDGVFTGYLPRDGSWNVAVGVRALRVAREYRGVQVKRRPGEPEAKVEIRLPATGVEVEVVTEEGGPVPRARVSADDMTRQELLSSVPTNEKGRVTFRALGPGQIRFEAESGELTSEAVTVEVREDQKTDQTLRLVVSKRTTLQGWVLGPQGPVFGASVQALGPQQMFGVATLTDVDGSFSLSLPRALAQARLVVMPPGFSMRVLAVETGVPGPIEVAVDQFGATLSLRLPEDLAELMQRGYPLVLHNGCVLSLPLLDQWRVAAGGAPWGTREISIPQVEPGEYTVCFVEFRDVARVLVGSWRPQQGCARGLASPNGVLTLALPASRDRAAGGP